MHVLKPKGDARVKDDYRGIAIGTALSKLYSMVLMARTDAWAEREGRRARGQAGFPNCRSTTDLHFVLQHVLERNRISKQRTYCAFIDFKKAYDSVNRELLRAPYSVFSWPAFGQIARHIMVNVTKLVASRKETHS